MSLEAISRIRADFGADFGVGGAGFRAGNPSNLFGDTDGNVATVPIVVNPAASRAAAEFTRNTYMTANPTWVDDYDATGNEGKGIILYYQEGSDIRTIGQTRVGGTWVDQVSYQGLQGVPGSGTDFSSISDNHIPAIGTAPDKLPYDSGLSVDMANNRFTTDKSLKIASNSVEFDEANIVSGGVRRLNVLDVDDNLSILGAFDYSEAGGSTRMSDPNLGIAGTSLVASTRDTTLADPASVVFGAATGQGLTLQYGLLPATTGTLVIQVWRGSDDTGRRIVNVPVTITQQDVDNAALPTPISKMVTINPVTTFAGDAFYVEFSGVQLLGGVQTELGNQTAPWIQVRGSVADPKEMLNTDSIQDGRSLSAQFNLTSTWFTVAIIDFDTLIKNTFTPSLRVSKNGVNATIEGRIVYDDAPNTDANNGDIYYSGSLETSDSGLIQIPLTATATPVPAQARTPLAFQVRRTGAAIVAHVASNIKEL